MSLQENKSRKLRSKPDFRPRRFDSRINWRLAFGRRDCGWLGRSARSDASGASSFLLDALGNSVALTDSTGIVQTQYTYDPFGKRPSLVIRRRIPLPTQAVNPAFVALRCARQRHLR